MMVICTYLHHLRVQERSHGNDGDGTRVPSSGCPVVRLHWDGHAVWMACGCCPQIMIYLIPWFQWMIDDGSVGKDRHL